jgi:hypothetical protein
MDEGLFSKYHKQIITRLNAKEKILKLLLEETGIVINESEIAISKKEVSLNISSVKRSLLVKKGCKSILQSIGYTLQG